MPGISEIMQTMDYGPAPEDDSAVRAWLALHADGLGHFIDGAFVPGTGDVAEVIEPARDTVIARIQHATGAEIDRAVAAARAAQPGWAALPGTARARLLYAIARQVQKRERFLAVLESIDNGKTIRETRDIDVPLVARHFYHHAGWAAVLDDAFPGMQPHGVCAQVIPWNFPLLMLAWKVAPALAAGNTVVLKPADLTPLTAHALAEICVEIGLPPGVLNIVQGGGDTGATLVAHPGVDKVAFTGSTAVGRAIRKATAGTGKALTLELGGKSPFVVCEDGDLDAAVEGVVDAVWFNQGEVCCAGSRVLVQEGVAEPFFAKLRTRLATLRVGDPLDKTMDVGAVVSHGQLARIRGLVAEGQAAGAVLHGAPVTLPERGSFCAPGFFSGAAPAHTVSRDEIFGPIAVTMTFRTPSEAIALANDTAYGLAASIWSQDIDRAMTLAAGIRAGVVWINGTNMFDANAPFGGMRESGFGREGGREGMLAYLRTPQMSGNARPAPAPLDAGPARDAGDIPALDITAKLYIGGKQTRADSGQSYSVRGADGAVIGQAALGNRKDIRNAVEAASKSSAWSQASAHSRAQVLYFLAENLSQRRAEFMALLARATGDRAEAEVAAAIDRCIWYAAQADKLDGGVQATQARHLTLALHEPWGVAGVVCPDEAPLLSFLSLVLPLLAHGNRVVAVASQSHPPVATTLYQVIETSDLPAGALNIVTGPRDGLAATLADHADVACLWYCGTPGGAADVERRGAGNLKAVWTDGGMARDWHDRAQGQGAGFLQRARQVKTVWLPYGI
jgi:aldehyde dehydrogenase (NAD+)